ncbi:MAG: ABC transporter ATP-binding protein [Chloroflexi bacterium]|nr:ABC transporter ATP-binding protein [Chloroflexota bacterium]MDA1145976.1 ABC transporter ATP-binding protein [Chloroflexota bacterium]
MAATRARETPSGDAVSSEVPAIEFRALTKHYGSRVALRGIDLRVGRGQLFGFLGPNGAGKTTAIRTLLDLIRPSAGQALALGLDSRADSLEVRRRIGYLPADAEFYHDMTGAELFRYVERIRKGVDHRYLARLIDSLELDAARPIGALSRGNRQKVGVVQALMTRPELVMMDEPTASLDPLMQDVVAELLREVVAEGRTVFFSSHVLAEVERLCSRAAVLREGEIVRVVDLAEERRLAPRRVRVRFASAVPADAFVGLDGVRVLRVADGEAEFETRESIDPLLKALAQHTVVELESSEPTLEDLFRSYYVDPTPEEQAVGGAG